MSNQASQIFVTPDGVERKLGVIPSTRVAAPAWSSNNLIPRSAWLPAKRRRSAVPIMDQSRYSDCVGHGAASAVMLTRDIAGMDFHLLSPTYLYMQINGNVDNGATLADAATVLPGGTCLMSECGEDTIYKSQVDFTSLQSSAKKFAVPAEAICQLYMWNDIVSSWYFGFSEFISVYVGPNFNSLSAEGVPPPEMGYGNHCVCLGDEIKLLRNGQFALEVRNSWGTSWGQDGCFFITEDHIAAQLGMSAFGIKYVDVDVEAPTLV